MVRLRKPHVLILAVLFLPLIGCERPDTHRPYQVFTGSVKALDVETGELFVRPEQAPVPWRPGRNVPCVATKDSEIYINDRFCRIDEIKVGDTIELVGYRGKEDRFVVSLANIIRSQAEPELPTLTQPTSKPTTKP